MKKSCSTLPQDDDRRISTTGLTCYLIGDIGKWQWFIGILMSLMKFSVPWVQLGIIFLAYPQEFRCKKPENANLSDDLWRHISQPMKDSDKEGFCELNDLNYSRIDTSYKISTNLSTIPCEYFEFNTTTYKSTIISDWSLVCTKAHHVWLSQVFLMFGVLLGNISFGIISDQYGRKTSLFLCIILQTIGGFASAFTPWFTGFIISRLMLALASGGITTVTFVLCLETVGGKWKNIIPILYHIPFGLGNTVLAGIAYMLRDWRQIQIVLSLVSATYLLFFIFISESPRWLLATGRHEKAIDTLEKICSYNKRNINKVRRTVLRAIEMQDICGKAKVKTVLTSKNLRTKSIILWIECFLSGISLFSFVQYVGIVSRNIFLNVSLNGLSVIPGTILTLIFLKYCTYKKTIIMSQLWTALCFLLIIAVPNNLYAENWPRIVFAVLGIMGLSISLPVLSIYISLVYPTEVRNAGVGIAIMFNRLGSMTSPFIIYLEKLSPASPYIILCLLTLLQAALLCFMPDISEDPTEQNNNKNSQEQAILPMISNNTKLSNEILED